MNAGDRVTHRILSRAVQQGRFHETLGSIFRLRDNPIYVQWTLDHHAIDLLKYMVTHDFSWNRQQCFQYAIARDNFDLLKFLTLRSPYTRKSLKYLFAVACRYNRMNMVQYLIKHKFDCSVDDLFFAFLYDRPEIRKRLLSYVGNAKIKEFSRRFPVYDDELYDTLSTIRNKAARTIVAAFKKRKAVLTIQKHILNHLYRPPVRV